MMTTPSLALSRAVIPNLGLATLAGVAGLGMIAVGIAQQRGRSVPVRQQLIRTYLWGSSRFRRNAPFVIIPGGIWFVVGAIAFAHQWDRWIEDCLGLVLLAGLVLQGWFLWQPPAWAKPRWLSAEQDAGFPSLHETPLARRGVRKWIRIALPIALMLGIVAATIVVTNPSVGALVGPVLVGLGAGVAYREQQLRARAAMRHTTSSIDITMAADSAHSEHRARPPVP